MTWIVIGAIFTVLISLVIWSNASLRDKNKHDGSHKFPNDSEQGGGGGL
jgi:hypothetical protein